MVECYRAGMIIRDLAEKFSVSPSSVKRILRRAGARKRRKPPG
jgi:Mor family transcriptional regulator